MSIATEITRLQNAKAALKESIEAKGVTVEDSAKLDEYPALVDTIPSGSKVMSLDDDVIFIDYDGTLLYTYTKEEFLALNSLPQLPSHNELKDAEWNWSLNGAKETVSDIGRLIIGAIYNIVDEGVILHITVKKPFTSYTNFCLNYSGGSQGDGGITIDWGDGTINTFTAYGNNNRAYHLYDESGNYKIKIISNSENNRSISIYDLSKQYAKINKFIINDSILYCTALGDLSNYGCKELWLGKNTVTSSSISGNTKYEKILVSKQVSAYHTNTAFGLLASANIDIKRYNLVLPTMPFESVQCGNINIISFPEIITTANVCNLTVIACNTSIIAIPKKTTGLGEWNSTFGHQVKFPSTLLTITYSLRANNVYHEGVLNVPEGVTALRSSALGFLNPENICILPSTLTSLTGNSLGASRIIYINAIVPPTLSSTININNIDYIYVPSESVEDYKTATNWSDIASKIFAIPTE